MVEILALTEKVKNTIQLGESHFREFKSAVEGRPGNKQARLLRRVCEDIGEALVAFANADGGDLLVGVEDDGSVTGVPHSQEDVASMLNAYKTHVHADSALPMLQFTQIEIESKPILFFSVAKGSSRIYQLPDGRCVRRQDRSTVPVTIERIMFDRQESLSREYDRAFVDGASVADLDLALLQSMSDNYLRGMSVEKYLQQVGLAEYTTAGLRLRSAAVLLFARDIRRWYPRSQVRILKIAGAQLKSGEQYNVLSDEFVEGNIFELLVRSWEALRPYLAYRTAFGSDAKFEQKYIYPELACREALINAIAHRDYTIQNTIDVYIFDDRMEIRSPGLVLSTLSIQDLMDLKGVHESRNTYIARVLRENKFMRELGEGMRRIFEVMEEHELTKPKIASSENHFCVTLYSRSVYTAKQEEWLSLFADFGLSSRQKRIVVLGMNGKEIAQKDIYAAMNTDDRNTYDREVTGLRNAGILKEIRTNAAATEISQRTRIPKRAIPRFVIGTPDVGATENACVVYVGNLPRSADEGQIRQAFHDSGEITKVYFPRDYQTGLPRGFAFVWFDTPDSARKAIDCSGCIIAGEPVRVSEYRPRGRAR